MKKNPFISLAQKAIELYINEGIEISAPDPLPDKFKEKAGVFVSIHKKNGDLRGCIGTFLPTKENIAKEIIANAISAASHDPRFEPIAANELSDLGCSVDILGELESVNDLSELDCKKYGILVKSGEDKSALLLPNLDGIDSVEQQLSVCCMKDEIDPRKEQITIYRFSVERHKESS